MVVLNQIFSKFALIGDELRLAENVEIKINAQGRISAIKPNSIHEKETKFSFHHHLLLPKFINSHTHLGDAILKDQAFAMSLNEAVGVKGHKYQVSTFSRTQRIAAMRTAIIQMIENGTSTCFDFREGGLDGIIELLEAKNDLPIDLRILGRHNDKSDLTDVLSQCDGLGLSTPLLYSQEELEAIQQHASLLNVLVATHIGEELEVIRGAFDHFGLSDLDVALKYLDPNILIHLTEYHEKDLKVIPSSKFIVFCPRSNAYFGLAFPPIDYFLRKKIPVGLGTDNVMITAPNILEELTWLVLRLKEQNINIDPVEALKLITINPSKALKISTGRIKTGFWADLLVIDLESRRTLFGEDPILTILFRCQLPADVSLNLFHGKVVSNDLV